MTPAPVSEPAPRRARCAVCGRPRPPLAVRDGDPYCSTTCCKAAHGVRDADPDLEDADSLTAPFLRHRAR